MKFLPLTSRSHVAPQKNLKRGFILTIIFSEGDLAMSPPPKDQSSYKQGPGSEFSGRPGDEAPEDTMTPGLDLNTINYNIKLIGFQINHIESKIVDMDKRYDRIEDKLDRFVTVVNDKFDKINDKINDQFNAVNQKIVDLDKRGDVLDTNMKLNTDYIKSVKYWLIIFGLSIATLIVGSFIYDRYTPKLNNVSSSITTTQSPNSSVMQEQLSPASADQ